MSGTEFYGPKGSGEGSLAIVSYPNLRYQKVTVGSLIYHCYAQSGTQYDSFRWFIALENQTDTNNVSVKFPQKDGIEDNGFVHQLSTTNLEANIAATIGAYTYGP